MFVRSVVSNEINVSIEHDAGEAICYPKVAKHQLMRYEAHSSSNELWNDVASSSLQPSDLIKQWVCEDGFRSSLVPCFVPLLDCLSSHTIIGYANHDSAGTGRRMGTVPLITLQAEKQNWCWQLPLPRHLTIHLTCRGTDKIPDWQGLIRMCVCTCVCLCVMHCKYIPSLAEPIIFCSVYRGQQCEFVPFWRISNAIHHHSHGSMCNSFILSGHIERDTESRGEVKGIVLHSFSIYAIYSCRRIKSSYPNHGPGGGVVGGCGPFKQS